MNIIDLFLQIFFGYITAILLVYTCISVLFYINDKPTKDLIKVYIYLLLPALIYIVCFDLAILYTLYKL